jgi:phosphopantetheinyl transferase (holo-ACP synthase)
MLGGYTTFYCLECGVELKKKGNHWVKHCTDGIILKDFQLNVIKAGKANKGKIRTEEQREHYRDSKLGEKNPQFGKTTSQAQKEAVSKALKGKPKAYKISLGGR